ncbi:hypothetical protein STEG23_035784, partial [Scotinomys teguina]
MIEIFFTEFDIFSGIITKTPQYKNTEKTNVASVGKTQHIFQRKDQSTVEVMGNVFLYAVNIRCSDWLTNKAVWLMARKLRGSRKDAECCERRNNIGGIFLNECRESPESIDNGGDTDIHHYDSK